MKKSKSGKEPKPGKLDKGAYYEKLKPSMSALVVKSHITEGLEFARKQRLPRAVRDAIPEHHG